MATEKLITINLLVDKKQQRVILAEAGKDFVDFLVSLLSMPVGSVVRLLSTKDMVGSLGDLYESIENLSDAYIQKNRNKDSILKPELADSPVSLPELLLPNSSESTSQKKIETSTKYYMCETHPHYVTNTHGTKCPNSTVSAFHSCSGQMNIEMLYVPPVNAINKTPPKPAKKGYVKGGVATYKVMDNLVVTPMSFISSVNVLKRFNAGDLSFLEEMVVHLGLEEGLELLKASFHSKTVLSDVFLIKNDTCRIHVQMASTKKLTIKLLVDKKQHRVIFAEAGKDFVDFLVSLFSMPVGSVVSLLSKKDMVGSLGDLYEGIENLSDAYIQKYWHKESILKPKLADFPVSLPELLLPNSGESTSQKENETVPKYYICDTHPHYVTDTHGTMCPGYSFSAYCPCSGQLDKEIQYIPPGNAINKTPPKPAKDGYVKGGVATYRVMDNLLVTPLSIISSVDVLQKAINNARDLSFLETMVVHLGLEEGLELLKASFQSKTVLSDVFLVKKEST